MCSFLKPIRSLVSLFHHKLLGLAFIFRGKAVVGPWMDLLKDTFHFAVVVAQVVERWHSVQASWVRVPDGLWFFGNPIYLFSLGVGLSLKKTTHKNATYSSFFFPVSHHLSIVNISIVLCQWIKERKIKKIPNRGWEKPFNDTFLRG